MRTKEVVEEVDISHTISGTPTCKVINIRTDEVCIPIREGVATSLKLTVDLKSMVDRTTINMLPHGHRGVHIELELRSVHISCNHVMPIFGVIKHSNFFTLGCKAKGIKN